MIHPKLESWIALLKCEINLFYIKAFTIIPMIFKLLFTAQDRKEYEWGWEKVRCPNRMSIIQNMFLFLPKCPYWLDNIYHKLHTTRHNKGCNCKRSGTFFLLIQYKRLLCSQSDSFYNTDFFMGKKCDHEMHLLGCLKNYCECYEAKIPCTVIDFCFKTFLNILNLHMSNMWKRCHHKKWSDQHWSIMTN